MSQLYERMAVIGCGLIGSSVVRAAREKGAVREIVVSDASEAVRERVVALGLADRVVAEPAEAVAGADLVVFATPVLAVTSHLPHLIAYNIVGTAADLEAVTRAEVMKYSAGGFRDFTRIAASDPTMWRDIFLANKDAVLDVLGRFTEDLQALSRAIRWGEGDKLHELFTRTREIRRGIIDLGQESPEPNFGRDRGKH